MKKKGKPQAPDYTVDFITSRGGYGYHKSKDCVLHLRFESDRATDLTAFPGTRGIRPVLTQSASGTLLMTPSHGVYTSFGMISESYATGAIETSDKTPFLPSLGVKSVFFNNPYDVEARWKGHVIRFPENRKLSLYQGPPDNAYGVYDSPFTFALWFFIEKLQGNNSNRLFGKQSETKGTFEYDCTVLSTGQINFTMFLSGSNDDKIKVQSSTSVSAGKWYHLAVTYRPPDLHGRKVGTAPDWNGSNIKNGLSLYLNGNDDTGTRTVGGSFHRTHRSANRLVLGNDGRVHLPSQNDANRGRYFFGYIADFAMWLHGTHEEYVAKPQQNRTGSIMTANEIRALYDARFGVQANETGFLQELPPRVEQRIIDSKTGSYPTVIRTGDSRTGKYSTSFNDQKTVLFRKHNDVFPGELNRNFGNYRGADNLVGWWKFEEPNVESLNISGSISTWNLGHLDTVASSTPKTWLVKDWSKGGNWKSGQEPSAGVWHDKGKAHGKYQFWTTGLGDSSTKVKWSPLFVSSSQFTKVSNNILKFVNEEDLNKRWSRNAPGDFGVSSLYSFVEIGDWGHPFSGNQGIFPCAYRASETQSFRSGTFSFTSASLLTKDGEGNHARYASGDRKDHPFSIAFWAKLEDGWNWFGEASSLNRIDNWYVISKTRDMKADGNTSPAAYVKTDTHGEWYCRFRRVGGGGWNTSVDHPRMQFQFYLIDEINTGSIGLAVELPPEYSAEAPDFPRTYGRIYTGSASDTADRSTLKWDHWCVTYDGTGGPALRSMRIYKNGIRVSENKYLHSGEFQGNTAPIPQLVQIDGRASSIWHTKLGYGSWTPSYNVGGTSAGGTGPYGTKRGVYSSMVGSTENHIFIGSRDGTNPEATGNGNTGIGPGHFSGRLDDVAIWNRVLDKGEVLAIVKNAKATPYYQESSFPQGLPPEHSTLAKVSTSSIRTFGSIVKGIGDSRISFTKGEDYSPFKDGTVMGLTKGFYLTGTQQDILDGFSSPLSSKTSFTVDITARKHHLITRLPSGGPFLSGALPAGTEVVDRPTSEYMIPRTGAPNRRWERARTGFCYFNFDLKQWEWIGSNRPWVSKSSFLTAADFRSRPGSGNPSYYDYSIRFCKPTSPTSGTNVYPMQFTPSPGTARDLKRGQTGGLYGAAMHEERPAITLKSMGYHLIGSPTVSSFAPFGPKYHATSSQCLSLSNHIRQPFLLEKVVIDIPVMARKILDPGPYPREAELRAGGMSEDVFTAIEMPGIDLDNYVFFAYRQRF